MSIELKDPVLDATDPQTRLLLLAEYWKRKCQELVAQRDAVAASGAGVPVPAWESTLPLCPSDTEIINSMEAEITAHRALAAAPTPDRASQMEAAPRNAGVVTPDFQAAINAAYPLTDSPHTSVQTHRHDGRIAFEKGWGAALATRAVLDPMRIAMIDVRHALQFANDTPGGGINDTIWMMHQNETLFDFIDAALAAPAAEAPGLGVGICSSNYATQADYQAALAGDSLVARNAALEEAAQVCDSVNNHDNPMTAADCADAIRAKAKGGVV